eukprot:TRINITY_DN1117_c0_g1_i1.p1 TRINITY_DN1117_c0_g1~~TRINITY_DN1117_c0_g1_i1.p1  ORF type:complete len:466 (-),score=106.05 TRINITY_DN1117_c0_g1_i1:1-1398(-)
MSQQKRAIISVYEKKGLAPLAKGLVDLGYELLSTGGTYTELTKEGLKVTKISDITNFPEILGGRVKTLHPAVHGGILARRNEEHLKELQAHNISPIDIVVCNLYPFNETIKKQGISEADAIEQIDIGGVALLRASAKNFESVTVLSDEKDYIPVLDLLKSGKLDLSQRKRLALKAFRLTASYDAAIATWLGTVFEGTDQLPNAIHISAERILNLRYGENPHQKGALYRFVGTEYGFEQIHAEKELSYNNIQDLESAAAIPAEFSTPCVAIIKHNTPCGLATGSSLVEAFNAALACDPISAFGSIIATNEEITSEFVNAVGKLFLEVLVGPSYSADALDLLKKKKKSCRVMLSKLRPEREETSLVIHSVQGGLLVQTRDDTGVDFQKWKVVTDKQPTEEQMKSLAFAWIAVKHCKSNAIVYVQQTATVGIGSGFTNRVDAVRFASHQAGDKAVSYTHLTLPTIYSV